MPFQWVDSNDGFDYRFLKSGELEFRDRRGRYHTISGVSLSEWFNFWDRYEELSSLSISIANDESIPNEAKDIESLYESHPRFKHLCDVILELNGIESDWISVIQLRWLLFRREDSDEIIEPPLIQLNRPTQSRHPVSKGNSSLDNKAALIAALSSYCDGDLKAAKELADSTSGRLLLELMNERSWQMTTPKDRLDAQMQAELENMKASGQPTVIPDMGMIDALREQFNVG